MNKKIVLTGGGTAGHVTPNIALIPFLKEQGYEIIYIGSYDGIEKKLILQNKKIEHFLSVNLLICQNKINIDNNVSKNAYVY